MISSLFFDLICGIFVNQYFKNLKKECRECCCLFGAIQRSSQQNIPRNRQHGATDGSVYAAVKIKFVARNRDQTSNYCFLKYSNWDLIPFILSIFCCKSINDERKMKHDIIFNLSTWKISKLF